MYLKLILTGTGSKLQIDNLVMEVIEKVLANITDYKPDHRINARLKQNHLITIERAKEYLTDHFTDDISLMQLAEYCYVSPFHFSRLFKIFTSESPHQFLLTLRLKNAKLRRMAYMLPSIILPTIAHKPFCIYAPTVLNHRSIFIKLKGGFAFRARSPFNVLLIGSVSL